MLVQRSRRRPALVALAIAAALVSGLVACAGKAPGYSASSPTEITCGCHDGATFCYDETAALAAKRGENADSAEELLYLSQRACFQESMAGCNTLGHFAKDWIKSCEHGDDVATSCTVAGFIYLHGVAVPRLNGRSYLHDPAASRAAFEKACAAGATVACRNAH
jgi:TPR repeat protein